MARAARKVAQETSIPDKVSSPAMSKGASVVDMPVTLEKFAQAFEAYMDAREERDRQEARMEQFKPIIVAYVKANGEHGKPMRPDDAKLEYNGFSIHHQFNPRWHDEAGVAWVQQELKRPDLTDAQREEYKRLVVMVPVLNREMWESMLARPDSPIPQDVADKVIPISYKLVVRDLAKKTCAKCKATVAKSFNFCPNCGTPLAEQFENAHRAKKS